MSVKRRRHRASGSLSQLKSALWAVVNYDLDLLADAEVDHELRLKAATSLTQTALAYCRVLEMFDMAEEMADLQRLANGNGHVK